MRTPPNCPALSTLLCALVVLGGVGPSCGGSDDGSSGDAGFGGGADAALDGEHEPDLSDTDGDGVPASSDNCPDVANPRQTDTDGDGVGNACDAVAWEGLADDRLIAALDARHADTHATPAARYQDARSEMFGEIDNEAGTVTCVYTGFSLQTRGTPDATVMNTEHTWPQSLGAAVEPMRSDLHHLFPSTADANNARGNLPFCEVVSGQNWQDGGSRRGEDRFGEPCFEPRDEHKGNVARAMLYFAAVYAPSVDSSQEAVFRAWNERDVVDAGERERNDQIEDYQGSRNPFIDYPELVDRISDH